MALFDKKFSDFFGLFDEDEYEEETAHVEGLASQTASQAREYPKAVNESRREPRFSENIERAAKDSQPTQGKKTQQDGPKLVAMKGGSRPNTGSNNGNKKNPPNNISKITIVEPRSYPEAMTIADKIISGEPVLINFYLIDEMQARRIVDFLTGTVYAQDGDIQRVGDEIFLCTPSDVEIDISVAQTLTETTFFD